LFMARTICELVDSSSSDSPASLGSRRAVHASRINTLRSSGESSAARSASRSIAMSVARHTDTKGTETPALTDRGPQWNEHRTRLKPKREAMSHLKIRMQNSTHLVMRLITSCICSVNCSLSCSSCGPVKFTPGDGCMDSAA
jgi:hypothetical protein